MPTPTYDLLSSTTLAASASSVTFSGLPTDGTYRDLVVVIDGTPSASDSSVNLTLNGDSSNNSNVYAYGNGSGTGSGTLSSTGIQVTYSPSGGRHIIIAQLMDYSATDKHKTVLARGNGPTSSDWVSMWAGRWASTSAVTSVEVRFAQTRTWNAGSTFSLYGIAS